MLILLRHGQAAGNAAGVLLGRADHALTDLGRRQAEAAAAALAGVARVISSPLGRARTTAEAFALPVEIDERWIELDYGELDERPLGEVGEDVWQRWRTDDTFAPLGGESFRQLGARVEAACEDLVADAAVDDIVVVSHVSPIKAAVAWALEVDWDVSWHMHLDTAAITRLRVSPRGSALVTFNETAHLAPLPRR